MIYVVFMIKLDTLIECKALLDWSNVDFSYKKYKPDKCRIFFQIAHQSNLIHVIFTQTNKILENRDVQPFSLIIYFG